MYVQSSEVSLYNVLTVLRYYRRSIAFFGMLLGLTLVYFNSHLIPERFEASSLIKVNLKSWNESLHDKSDSERRQDLVSLPKSELLSRSNIGKVLSKVERPPQVKSELDEFINQYGLYRRNEQSIEKEISWLQSAIILQADESNPELITLKFRSNSPEFSSMVIDSIIDEYIKSKLGNEVKSSESLIKSLSARHEEVEQALKTAEGNLTLYMKSNSSSDETMTSVTEAKKALRETDSLIKDLEFRELKLKELLSITPGRVSVPTPSTQVGDELLRRKIAELTELKVRATDRHPDIQRLTEEIDKIKSSGLIDKMQPSNNPNSDYSRIQSDLVSVQSNLIRARYQQGQLSKVVSKGLPLIEGNQLKGQLTLIDKLMIDKVNLETRLTNEKIKSVVINSSYVLPITVIDKAFASSLLIKDRYILMLISLIASIGLVYFIHAVKCYFMLNRLQVTYGSLSEVPRILEASKTAEIIDENGRIQCSYDVTYEKINTLKFVASHSSSMDMSITPTSQVIYRPEYVSSNNDATIIELSERTASVFNSRWPVIISATGYIIIAIIISNEIFSKYFYLN